MKIRCCYGSLTAAALATAALVAVGCAESEPFDYPITHIGGAGNGGAGTGDSSGVSPAGSAGATGAAGVGVAGAAGSNGAAGATGAAGAGITGAAGVTGGAGAGGRVTGTGGSGVGGRGGAGASGTAGRGGAGASSTAGRGGAAGSGTAGRGGSSGGSAGRGGSVGTGGGGSIDAGVAPDGGAAPTFTQVYDGILVVYCAGSACHNPGTAHNVSFASKSSAYTAVRNQVTPGNGASSSFYSLVNTGRMPEGQAKLSATNLALIKAWIDAGALNN